MITTSGPARRGAGFWALLILVSPVIVLAVVVCVIVLLIDQSIDRKEIEL